MKLIAILLSFFMPAYGLAPEIIEVIRTNNEEVGKQCKVEIGVSEAELELLHHSPPTTDKGKCFLACMNKKGGLQNSDGKINKTGALASLETLKEIDEEFYIKAKQITETCLEKVKDLDNECETALEIHKCALVEQEKVGFPKFD